MLLREFFGQVVKDGRKPQRGDDAEFQGPKNYPTVPGSPVLLILAGTLFFGLFRRGSRSLVFSLCRTPYIVLRSSSSGTVIK